MGLVAGLGRLTDGEEHYLVITDPRAPDWLDSFMGPNTRPLIAGSQSPARSAAKKLLSPALPALRSARALALRAAPWKAIRSRAVAAHNPIVERANPDVVHFPYQWMHRTTAPSLFNPWDLQHLHFPEFFDRRALADRKAMYRVWCSQCTRIEVASKAVKRDLIEQMQVPAEKIIVIPRGAPSALFTAPTPEIVDQVRLKYHLPQDFAYYPAHTWPHKNHLRLFRALVSLRDHYGLTMNLICSGALTDFWPVLQSSIEDLNLRDQVRFLGFVPSGDVRCLYRAADFTILPTLFEGAGLPLVEAMSEGSPLLCSSLTVLHEQAGPAALYFDPLSPDDIARRMRELWGNESLKNQLRRSGYDHSRVYSWHRTALICRAAYRKLAGRPLTVVDQALLEAATNIKVDVATH